MVTGTTRRTLSLNGQWELRDEKIAVGADRATQIAEVPDGWIPTPVPGDVRQGLVAAGRIAEPLVGLNSLDQHWVEERSWWFRKRFDVADDVLAADAVELEMHGLDCRASIWLNGVRLGDHPSAFRPFVAEVKRHLVPAGNVLLVRLTHGAEDVSLDDVDRLGGVVPTEAGRGRPERGEGRRVFVRKPQYSWGWDWAPRAATVAIAGDVLLRALGTATVRDLDVRPSRSGRDVRAMPLSRPGRDVEITAVAEVEWLHPYASGAGRVHLAVTDDAGGEVARVSVDAFLQCGVNYVEVPVRIEGARLWWPCGMGEQHRYTLRCALEVDGAETDALEIPYGIRFVELETSRTFALRINGVKMFCKGANWIPADSLYARLTDEKVDALVTEARRAGLNMLRIWGGGLYERDAFYEACDREGILIWHDFMFACAPYPDDREGLLDEVTKEADYQTRRLRTRACMGLWCGSNESLYVLGIGSDRQTTRGTVLLGRVLPAAVRRNSPDIPYWYSSPAGGATADSWEEGDSHHWQLMMNRDMATRIAPEKYDECGALFVSEFGYVGPPVGRTVREYLDGAPFVRTDRTWQHHNNTFEQDTVDAGIGKHYADASRLSPDEYLLYGGLVQGTMLGYALESLRAKGRCNGALFWMYNDCWGEVGWTIIDYYLRRKISWYFVRRAFAPRRLVLREADGRIAVTLANDSPEPVRGELEYGYASLDGATVRAARTPFSAGAHSRGTLVHFERGDHDPTAGVWFARAGSVGIAPATLRAVDVKRLRLVAPALKTSVKKAAERAYAVDVEANVFAHAVTLALPEGAVPADDYFDLLPGEKRSVEVVSPVELSADNVGATSVITPSPG